MDKEKDQSERKPTKYKRKIQLKIILKRFKPFLVLFGFIVVLTTVLALLPERCREGLVYSLFVESDKALVVSGVVGFFVRIVSESIMTIIRKEADLKEVGIKEIAGGISSQDHIDKTFGKNGECPPSNLKLFFIIGNLFLTRFADDIVKTVEENGTEVQILLADENSTGFLDGMQAFKYSDEKSSKTYSERITEIKGFIKAHIIDEISDKKRNRVQVRQYQNEYRLSLRVACFKTGKIISWSDMIPPNGTAADFKASSIFVSEYDGLKDDVCINYANAFNDYFDSVWKKYENKQVDFSKL